MTIDVVLEKDLQWREAELASLKRLAINATSNSVTHQSLLRALWALLYAHYEGFTKFAWDTLLDHIQGEKLTKAWRCDSTDRSVELDCRPTWGQFPLFLSPSHCQA